MTSILEPKHACSLYGYWEATHNTSELDGNSVYIYKIRATRDPNTGEYTDRRDELPSAIVSFDDGLVRYFRSSGGYYHNDSDQREEYTFEYFRTLLRSLNYLSNDDKLIIGQLIGTYLTSYSSAILRVDNDGMSENIHDWYKVLADTNDNHGVTPNLSCNMVYVNYLIVLSMWLIFQQNKEFKHITDHWISDIVSYASEFEHRDRTRVGVADDADEILTRELPNILKSFSNRKTYNLYSVTGLNHIPDNGIIHLHVKMASTDLNDEEEETSNEVK